MIEVFLPRLDRCLLHELDVASKPYLLGFVRWVAGLAPRQHFLGHTNIWRISPIISQNVRIAGIDVGHVHSGGGNSDELIWT